MMSAKLHVNESGSIGVHKIACILNQVAFQTFWLKLQYFTDKKILATLIIQTSHVTVCIYSQFYELVLDLWTSLPGVYKYKEFIKTKPTTHWLCGDLTITHMYRIALKTPIKVYN